MPEEKGHAKNIANFAQLISILNSLGAIYNPSSALIKLPALNAAHTAAISAQSESDHTTALEIIAVNERAAAFEPLSKLITRVGNAAAANITDRRFLDDLAAIARKIRGQRTDRPADDPATLDIDESQRTISASQMSFDNRIQHFAEFIALLNTNADYAPNENELKISALEVFLDQLRLKNTAAEAAETAARNQRAVRNSALYAETDGILARVALIKNYLKSIFDADHPQYRQIQALKFKKPGS
jgi:hypothetical protein